MRTVENKRRNGATATQARVITSAALLAASVKSSPMITAIAHDVSGERKIAYRSRARVAGGEFAMATEPPGPRPPPRHSLSTRI